MDWGCGAERGNPVGSSKVGERFLNANRRTAPLADFRGRTALVTGGSRGLGFAIARELAAAGIKAVAICAREEAGLEQARKHLARDGARVLAMRTDITDRGQVEALFQAVTQRFGHLDLLVNATGTMRRRSAAGGTAPDGNPTRNGFWAPLYVVLAARTIMRVQGGGHIVNVGSLGGQVTVRDLLAGDAGALALIQFARALRDELARDGIAVTTVCPRLVRASRSRHDARGHRHAVAAGPDGHLPPGLSARAWRVAQRIIRACGRGDAEVGLSRSARVAMRALTLSRMPTETNGG